MEGWVNYVTAIGRILLQHIHSATSVHEDHEDDEPDVTDVSNRLGDESYEKRCVIE